MASQLLSLLGWSFLPELVTSNLQSFYYGLTIRAGDRRPVPGTAVYAKHRRRIYIGVIVTYLLYTLYEADWEMRRLGDFYSDLGVPYDVGDKALQSRFRKLTLLHHPDKVTDSNSLSEAYYIRLQTARETLSSSAKRFAYERFGPDVVHWKHCNTVREYIKYGLKASVLPFYIGSLTFMVVMDCFGLLHFGLFWRYLATAALFLTELYVVTHPSFTAITLVPVAFNPVAKFAFGQLRQPYLPYQAIQFARKGMVTFFVALSRLGPVLVASYSASSGRAPPTEDSEEETRRKLDALEKMLAFTNAEAGRLVQLDAVPFAKSVSGSSSGGADAGAGAAASRTGTTETSQVSSVKSRPVAGDGVKEFLKNKLKAWFVIHTVRSNPAVQRAAANVMNARRSSGGGGGGGDSGGDGVNSNISS